MRTNADRGEGGQKRVILCGRPLWTTPKESFIDVKFVNTGILDNVIPTGAPQDTAQGRSAGQIFGKVLWNAPFCKQLNN